MKKENEAFCLAEEQADAGGNLRNVPFFTICAFYNQTLIPLRT